MADIINEINKFKTAVYGEEVRGAMIDLANKVNNSANSAEAAANDARSYTEGMARTIQSLPF